MPGPAKRPALAVVREGNPSHRPVPESVILPPADLVEPDWALLFPDVKPPREPKEPEQREDESDEDFDRRLTRYETRRMKYDLALVARDGARACRARAAEEWQRVVPVLTKSVGLSNPDYSVTVDLCVCVARLHWCEIRLAAEGLITMGQRGPCRNPLTTVATQYRTQLKTYIRELGLSPSARTGMPPRPDGDDGDDPFDA